MRGLFEQATFKEVNSDTHLQSETDQSLMSHVLHL
jgi:hypothetical protein